MLNRQHGTVQISSWPIRTISFVFAFAIAVSISGLIQLNEALAQQANPTQRQDSFEKSKKRISTTRVQPDDLDSIGYKVMDGVVIIPEIRVEGGYDSNFDEFFPEEGSSYGLIDGSFLLGYIKEDQAVTLTFKGSYDRFSELKPEDRWDAGVNLDTYYRLSPNLEYSSSLFYYRDEISLINSETFSSHSKLDYTAETFTAYIQSESYKLRYIGDEPDLSFLDASQRPFLRNGAFNVERSEISGGGVWGPDRLVGLYGSAGIGVSDFTDQPDVTRLDRDASEFWLIGGVRLNLSPYLLAELGWRYNERDIKDRVIGNYDSNGFDAKITWVPNDYLTIVFEADKFFAEPSAAFSVVADVERYEIRASIKTSTRSDLDIYASHELRREIGSNLKYEEETIGAEYRYQVTSTHQFYVTALYEETAEGCTCTDYNRFKIGVGYKINFVRNPGDLDIEENYTDRILPGVSMVETRISYSRLVLPEMNMVAIINNGFTQVTGNGEDHDGKLDGARIDFRIPGFAGIQTSEELNRLGLGGRDLSFNLAGYYAHYSSDQTTHCASSGVDGHCVYFNIFDSQPAIVNSTGPSSDFTTTTKRDVDSWGVALETKFNNGISPLANSPFRVGLALKALQQETHLVATETTGNEQVDYYENLDSFYYGIYFAVERSVNLGNGFSLGMNAEAGAYYVDTSYKGRYTADLECGCANIHDSADAKASDQDISFIGSLRVELNKDVGWGTFGLFAEGEYYSYAPKVKYNNNDNPSVTGTNVGTSIESDEAYSYSFGGRVNIPLN